MPSELEGAMQVGGCLRVLDGANVDVATLRESGLGKTVARLSKRHEPYLRAEAQAAR